MVVHGDLFPSNVLVDGPRVAVVDWELAGIGPALRDLAALVSGRWTAERRRALAIAYREQAASAGPVDDLETLAHDLDLASLHLALCRLGSDPGWTPPVEHRHDWFGEAMSLARRIDAFAA
jgi:aminoglycoside phosphotransferase (APT) family kinase protein